MSIFDQEAWDNHRCSCSECHSDIDFFSGGCKPIEIAPGVKIAATSFVDQVQEKGFGKRSQVANCALTPPGFIQQAASEIDLFKTLDRIETERENAEYEYRVAVKNL